MKRNMGFRKNFFIKYSSIIIKVQGIQISLIKVRLLKIAHLLTR